jgi:hypothetical protein
MMAYPKSKFLAMAAFDTVASLLTFIPAAFISGDLMVLLLQVMIGATVPLSAALFCFLLLRGVSCWQNDLPPCNDPVCAAWLQAVIPVSLAASVLYLNKRYAVLHVPKCSDGLPSNRSFGFF